MIIVDPFHLSTFCGSVKLLFLSPLQHLGVLLADIEWSMMHSYVKQKSICFPYFVNLLLVSSIDLYFFYKIQLLHVPIHAGL